MKTKTAWKKLESKTESELNEIDKSIRAAVDNDDEATPEQVAMCVCAIENGDNKIAEIVSRVLDIFIDLEPEDMEAVIALNRLLSKISAIKTSAPNFMKTFVIYHYMMCHGDDSYVIEAIKKGSKLAAENDVDFTADLVNDPIPVIVSQLRDAAEKLGVNMSDKDLERQAMALKDMAKKGISAESVEQLEKVVASAGKTIH